MSPVAIRVIPFVAWIVLMAIQGALPAASAASFDPAWGYAVRTVVVCALLVGWWREYTELQVRRRSGLGTTIEAIIVGLLVFVAWIWLGPLVRIGEAGEPAIVRNATGAPERTWLAFRLVGTGFVVPVMEELFWRSVVARRVMAHAFETVNPRALSPAAIAISSVLFALEHREIVAGFVAGVAYAWIYRRRGDLRDAVIAHAVTNGVLAVFVLRRGAYEFW